VLSDRPLGPSKRCSLAQVTVERTIVETSSPGRNQLRGQEKWCCLYDPAAGLGELRNGLSPGTRPFCRPRQGLNPCPIFTVVLCDPSATLRRMAMQLTPDTGHIIDVRGSTQHLAMSLAMDSKEEQLIRQGVDLLPISKPSRDIFPADSPSQLEMGFQHSYRSALGMVADVRCGDMAGSEWLESFRTFVQAGSQVKARNVLDRDTKTIRTHLHKLQAKLGGHALICQDPLTKRQQFVLTDLGRAFRDWLASSEASSIY
jgi:hypothetical protein